MKLEHEKAVHTYVLACKYMLVSEVLKVHLGAVKVQMARAKALLTPEAKHVNCLHLFIKLLKSAFGRGWI